VKPATKAVLVVAAVAALGGGARFWHISHPPEKYFDENYYASDGCLYSGIDYRECDLVADVERSWVHPPLGKYLIAWGIDGFGNGPFGWRVSGAAAGTATIALAGALAFMLTGSALWAGAGALLLATEHLNFVQSRLAMLDIFLAFFSVLAVTLLVWDRKRRDRLDEAARPPPVVSGAGIDTEGLEVAPMAPSAVHTLGRSGVRPLRLLAGASLGAAMAVKWSGILLWAAVVTLAVGWEWGRRRRAGYKRPFVGTLAEESPSLILGLVVVPLAVYVASWLPWLSDRGYSLGELWKHHFGDGEMLDYHLGLSTLNEEGEPIHPYMSEAWTWLLMLRPVAYYYDGTDTTAAEVLGMANPVLFWCSLVVIPFLVFLWRRDWRAGAVAAPILFQYLPWLVVSRPLFLFYLTPLSPFLAVGAAYGMYRLSGVELPERKLLMGIALAGFVAAVGVFVFFWPVLVGDTISMEAWRARMWLPGWV
jgi:dolichyl-phosphate-mannose--protein O-mannosyl transferase